MSGHLAHAVPSATARIRSNRPVGVTVIGWFAFLGIALGVVWIGEGIGQMAEDFAIGTLTIVGGVVAILLSGVLCSGLIRGREWARRLYLWLLGLGLVADVGIGILLSEFSGWSFAVGLLVYGVVAYVLTRPSATAFFRRDREALPVPS